MMTGTLMTQEGTSGWRRQACSLAGQLRAQRWRAAVDVGGVVRQYG